MDGLNLIKIYYQFMKLSLKDMKKKYKILALIGESGSGKDTLLNEIMKADKNKILHKKISVTDRPKRDYEIEGIDYLFVNEEYFEENEKDLLERDLFNISWNYGTFYSSLSEDKINIGVFTPRGLEQLLNNENIKCISVLLKAEDKKRLIRSLSREKTPDIEEIFRRYSLDKINFKGAEELATFILPNNNEQDKKYNTDYILEIAKRWT